MSSAASLSKKDVRVLRRARRILESRGLPADAVFQFGGDRSVSRDQQVLGRLAAEGVEVHDMGAFGEELVAEAKAEAEELEEVRLDEEEEARWGECQADWCARCVRYLHVDPFHVCQFERDDKCERCIAQGRGGGSACVATPADNDEEVRRLLFCAHQARHYGSEVARGRVVVRARQVDVRMRRKSVRAGRGRLPSVEVVVPAPRTPSPVSPAAQAEAPPSTTRSLLGRFRDMLSRG